MYGIPNCVPEYYREQREREEYEWEQEEKRRSYYEQNKAHIDKRQAEGCAWISFHPDECEKCSHGEETGPIAEWDDVPSVLCDDWEDCPVFRNYAIEHWPDTPLAEVYSWFKGEQNEN